MALKSVDASLLKKMFLAGAKSLEAQKEIINELNVFPVPDGDTGTNMTLTILSAVKEIGSLEEVSMKTLAKAISSGSLKGARGNSGVILSQLFRGFCKSISACEELTVPVAAEAFGKAVDTAYKAVMKPKEGTILTVARAGAEAAAELQEYTEDVEEFLDRVIERMQIALDNTPELLPVLKEAGVVDSGGTGLLEVMRGARLGMNGEEIDLSSFGAAKPEAASGRVTGAGSNDISTADIKFGYCTEFIILLEKEFDIKDETDFKTFLSSIGDSIVCVADDDVVKVHVHTNDPGLAIQKALTYGQLTRMKIDNMREEHNERVITASGADVNPAPVKEAPKAPAKELGFIAVSIGEGMNEIFRGLGVDYVIEGGQTMNPSTEDMLTAIDQVNAKNVFILPNNGNVILAATQAKSLVEDKNIIVIPSKTAPQGISAMVSFLPELSAEENEQMMVEALGAVKSGEVTYAVRDTSYDGKDIHEGDIMGIADAGILAVGKGIHEVSCELVDALVDEDSAIVSIYYGAETSEEDANALADAIAEAHPDLDVETHFGGQPIYYYVLSVE
ncbi:MAG: DAK2 domain-containing protein [Lachnospiraceae bacterium]|nr:DAK2 domain-containing protein [Lachnospiraceae bacterium]